MERWKTAHTHPITNHSFPLRQLPFLNLRSFIYIPPSMEDSPFRMEREFLQTYNSGLFVLSSLGLFKCEEPSFMFGGKSKALKNLKIHEDYMGKQSG